MSTASRTTIRWRIAWTILTLIVIETVVCAISALPAIIIWIRLARLTDAHPAFRVAVFAVAAMPSYVLFALCLLIVSPLAMRVTGWRTPRDVAMRIADMDWPLLDWGRSMAAIRVARVLAGTLFCGSPLWTVHLRLSGARIGRGVYINSLSVSDYNLLEFADSVVIGAGAHVSGHTVEGGIVRTGGVRLQRNVTVGIGSIIEIGVDAGANCQVGALSFVPKFTKLQEDRVYVGIPAHELQ